MNLPLVPLSPLLIVLLKWTCLLAFGWLANRILRRRHARWRLILWRSILCFGLVLPVLQSLHGPMVRIQLHVQKDDFTGFETPLLQGGALNPPLPAGRPVPMNVNAIRTQSATPRPISWAFILCAGWILGCGLGVGRLIRLILDLARLRKESCEANSDLLLLASQIQRRLNVLREVEVRISASATSPFVCGLIKPAIILPRVLAEQMPPKEMTALLSHEIAHLCRHDVEWCVVWQWMKAVCWFHPLVWGVPAAHNLACDQESDRIASGQLEDEDVYAQMLARLALRVLALPPEETTFALNGSSRIAQRLNILAQNRMGVWDWKRTVAGFSLVGSVFLVTAICGFSESQIAAPAPSRGPNALPIDSKFPLNDGVYADDGRKLIPLDSVAGAGKQAGILPVTTTLLVYEKGIDDPKTSGSSIFVREGRTLWEKPPKDDIQVAFKSVEGHPGVLSIVPMQPWKPGLYWVMIGRRNWYFFNIETPDEKRYWNESLAEHPDNWMAQMLLGEILLYSGEHKLACDHLLIATQLNPDCPTGHYDLGESLLWFGKNDEAIKQFELAATRSDDRQIFATLGYAYEHVSRHKEAIKAYRHAIVLDPKNACLEAALGRALVNAGEFDEAIESDRQALQLNPNSAEAHENLGYALTQNGKNAEATKEYELAAKISGDKTIDTVVGDAFIAANRYDDAMNAYHHAIELDPKNERAHANLGYALMTVRPAAQAIPDLQEAVKLDPNDRQSLANLQWALGHVAGQN